LSGDAALLKLPGGAFQVKNLEVDRIEKNDFGAVKVSGSGLLCYRTRYGSESLLFRVARWRQALQSKGYLKYSPFLLLPLMIWIFWRIKTRFLKGRKARKIDISKRENYTVTAGGDSAFYRIEERLSELVLNRNSWETLSVWLDRIESTWGQKLPLEVPRKLLALHYRYRFDPRGLSADEKEQMIVESADWLSKNDLNRYKPKSG
jgi:hypothetical protein